MNADGTDLRNLTNHKGDDYVLSWSPDGSRLAFFSTRSGWLEMYVVDVETGAILRLTDTQATNPAYNYPISWSPDGEFIFATRANPWVTGNFTRKVVLDRIRTDGSGVQNISSFDKQYQFWNMLMSPDGQYMAYTAQGDEGYGVHSAQMSAEGLMAPHLVSMNCYSFTWMPNSHRLLCADGGTLYMMELTGGEKEKVGGDPPGYANSFSASPDGQWVLALYQFYSGQSDLTKQTFVAISMKDASMVQVVSDAAIEAETSAGWSWSGDSQWIAYTSHQFGPRDIFIINIFDTNSSRQIAATTLGENYNPRWQP